jgi:hypothetical protein
MPTGKIAAFVSTYMENNGKVPGGANIQAAGDAWANWGIKPKSNQDEVLTDMSKRGKVPRPPLNAKQEADLREKVVARDTAVAIAQDIEKPENLKLLGSMIDSAKIKLAISPDTSDLVISRVGGLTDQEAHVAAQFQKMAEHINLLRGPLGATGFRSGPSYQNLQAQAGRLLQDPRIIKETLDTTIDNLQKLNNADKMVLPDRGEGGNGQVPAAVNKYKDLQGQHRITLKSGAVWVAGDGKALREK